MHEEPQLYQESVNPYEHLVRMERGNAMDASQARDFMESWEHLESKMIALGGRYVKDWNGEMQNIARIHPNLLVRRERPRVVLDALLSQGHLEITQDDQKHGGKMYPNAGVIGADGYGLRIPYQRGFGGIEAEEGGRGKIVSILGFLPNASMEVIPLSDDVSYAHYDKDPKERSMVRMVKGNVPVSDIRFLLVRFPRKHVPEEFLTEQELEYEDQKFVNRLFVFGEKKDQPLN